VTVNSQPQGETCLLTIDELNKQICDCKKCRLWKDASQAVPGEGPEKATVMFVGQNPGAEEDRTGRPFVGRAGKLLDQILLEHGIKREEIFITNIVKHVSPKNRKPFADEIKACVPWLTEQISIIKPQKIVLMGIAARKTPREKGVEYFEILHPSAALRFTFMRKKFKEQIAALAKQL
jgi:DNA polymerase